MPRDFDPRSATDFQQARWKSFVRSVLGLILGRPNRLLSFSEVGGILRIGGPIYRGVATVPVNKIVGSVDRYRDFDRTFLPTQSHTADRWRRINRAWYEEVSLPPIVLYKVGDAYFVVDGNHRVSVAREQGQEFIDAEVRECSVKVPVTPDLTADDLEALGEQVEFLERTDLLNVVPGADIRLSVLGGYLRLLEHIAVHRYFMGLDFRRDIPEPEAVAHWYETVYSPVVRAIEASGMLRDFPGRTVGDFYLWVMDHQHYLLESGEIDRLKRPEDAAETFLETYGSNGG